MFFWVFSWFIRILRRGSIALGSLVERLKKAYLGAFYVLEMEKDLPGTSQL